MRPLRWLSIGCLFLIASCSKPGVEFAPPGEGFSVVFPTRPETEKKEGFRIYSSKHGSTLLQAEVYDFPTDRPLNPEEVLGSKGQSGLKVQKEENVQLGEWRGKETHFQPKMVREMSVEHKSREYVVNHRVIKIAVAGPVNEVTSGPVERFWNSLKILEQPKPGPSGPPAVAPPPSVPPVVPPPSPPDATKLTAANFNAVQNGMSEAEVVALLGPAARTTGGTQNSPIKGAPRITVKTLIWNVGSTATMAGTVTLHDNKVVKKTAGTLK
jgi:hypothetical protein